MSIWIGNDFLIVLVICLLLAFMFWRHPPKSRD